MYMVTFYAYNAVDQTKWVQLCAIDIVYTCPARSNQNNEKLLTLEPHETFLMHTFD